MIIWHHVRSGSRAKRPGGARASHPAATRPPPDCALTALTVNYLLRIILYSFIITDHLLCIMLFIIHVFHHHLLCILIHVFCVYYCLFIMWYFFIICEYLASKRPEVAPEAQRRVHPPPGHPLAICVLLNSSSQLFGSGFRPPAVCEKGRKVGEICLSSAGPGKSRLPLSSL